MRSSDDTTVRRRWRLARWIFVLLAVSYLAALSFLWASSTAPALTPEMAALIGAGAVVLLGLGVATARRRWRSPGALLALSGATSLMAVAALYMAVEVAARQSSGPYRLFSLGSVIREITHGYWPTLVVLLALLFFTLIHAESRALVDSIIPIPVLLWGLDTTSSHWLGFNALAHDTAFFMQIYWLGALVGTVVLLFVLAISVAWRWRCGKREIRPGNASLIGLTVLAVYADWSFSLFITSMLLIR